MRVKSAVCATVMLVCLLATVVYAQEDDNRNGDLARAHPVQVAMLEGKAQYVAVAQEKGRNPADVARGYLVKYKGIRTQLLRGKISNFRAAGGRTNNCADFVSAVLINSGQLSASKHQVNVGWLKKTIIRDNWKKIPCGKSSPGDVWISYGSKHTAIVSRIGAKRYIGSNGWSTQYITEARRVGGACYTKSSIPKSGMIAESSSAKESKTADGDGSGVAQLEIPLKPENPNWTIDLENVGMVLAELRETEVSKGFIVFLLILLSWLAICFLALRPWIRLILLRLEQNPSRLAKAVAQLGAIALMAIAYLKINQKLAAINPGQLIVGYLALIGLFWILGNMSVWIRRHKVESLLAGLATVIILASNPAGLFNASRDLYANASASTSASLSNKANNVSRRGANAFNGNSIWVWQMAAAKKKMGARSDNELMAILKKGGFDSVFVKAGDGGDAWSQFTPALIAAAHKNGLGAFAWTFVYCRDPVAEAKVAISALTKGADGVIFDAESACKGKAANATKMLQLVRKAYPNAPLAESSFAYLHYHRTFPLEAFDKYVDVHMPQIYWKSFGDPVEKAVRTTVSEYRKTLGKDVVVMPVGQTHGRVPPAELLRFFTEVKKAGLPGASLWSAQHITAAQRGALLRRR